MSGNRKQRLVDIGRNERVVLGFSALLFVLVVGGAQILHRLG